MTAKFVVRVIVVLLLQLALMGQMATAASTTSSSADPGPSPASLHFSTHPDEVEIFRARVFDEPLIPTGGHPPPAETAALAEALSGYAARAGPDDFSGLTAFLAAYPNSAWTPSLLLHLGAEYYNTGHYSKALEAWEQAWQQFRGVTNGPAKAQADRALGELARMYSKLGRMDELRELLDTTSDRTLTGPGTQLIHAAQQALWMMRNRPELSFRCGPLALKSILAQSNASRALNSLIFNSRSTTNGFSLLQVGQLSRQLGLNYQMAFRSPGAELIVPAVVHWRAGHYAALLQNDGDQFLVQDFTFRRSLRMSASALDEEASGYFLVPPGQLPSGWRIVSEPEAQGIWGKGTVSAQTTTATTPYDTQTGGDNGGQCTPMTSYTMDTMLVSLNLHDAPMGYKPPVGPAVRFKAVYNGLEADQPATFYYSNLGPKWTCNWISYITDNPQSPGSGVSFYVDGGGTLSFSGYNSSTKSYASELMSHTVLILTSSSSYELQYSDGSKKEFTQSDGSTGTSRRVFLTQIIDPAGNSLQLGYDSELRITNVIDAIGQSTTFLYTNPVYSNAITAVIDPFGRAANLQYNAAGMLTQITDVLGLTSQYTYGPNDFISALNTSYGNTIFQTGVTNGSTWL